MLVSKSKSHFTGSESWSALLSYFYIFHTPRLCRLWAFSLLTISWCIPIKSLTQTGWLCYRTLLCAEIEAKLSINNCMYHSLRQRWNHRLDSWYDLIFAVTIEWSDDEWLHGEISVGRRTALQWFYLSWYNVITTHYCCDVQQNHLYWAAYKHAQVIKITHSNNLSCQKGKIGGWNLACNSLLLHIDICIIKAIHCIWEGIYSLTWEHDKRSNLQCYNGCDTLESRC